MIDKDHIIANLREVYDPEISVNVYDLGLIYDIDIDQENKWVKITHTLTSAFCPFADAIVKDISDAGYKNQEINHVEVITTFEPLFTMDSVPLNTRALLGWL
jgi:metal-sulfur cluster biosynthetic enzyme|tara:strand:- start:214 stop:519 length:306 start_codon:yes stop_codon:yes gene_type:complete